MIVPHVVMQSRRRDGKKATPRQRLAAILTATIASLVSAIVGMVSSWGPTADTTALIAVVVGLAFVGGIVVARVVGGRGRAQ